MQSYKCLWGDCSESYENLFELFNHAEWVHIDQRQRGNVCLSCNWAGCSEHRDTRSHIVSHLRVHIPLRSYQCLICGKSFLHMGDKNRHLKSHNGEQGQEPPPDRTPTPSSSSNYVSLELSDNYSAISPTSIVTDINCEHDSQSWAEMSDTHTSNPLYDDFVTQSHTTQIITENFNPIYDYHNSIIVTPVTMVYIIGLDHMSEHTLRPTGSGTESVTYSQNIDTRFDRIQREMHSEVVAQSEFNCNISNEQQFLNVNGTIAHFSSSSPTDQTSRESMVDLTEGHTEDGLLYNPITGFGSTTTLIYGEFFHNSINSSSSNYMNPTSSEQNGIFFLPGQNFMDSSFYNYASPMPGEEYDIFVLSGQNSMISSFF